MTGLYVIGIDPGKDGAAVILGPSDPGRWGILSQFQPNLKVGSWDQQLPRIGAWVRQLLPLALAIIEEVESRPGEGHMGAFSFGYNAGSWAGLMAGLGIPFILRPPNVWEAALALSSDKTEHRKRAREEFPPFADLFKPKGSHGLADAALIALFGTRFLSGRRRARS